MSQYIINPDNLSIEEKAFLSYDTLETLKSEKILPHVQEKHNEVVMEGMRLFASAKEFHLKRLVWKLNLIKRKDYLNPGIEFKNGTIRVNTLNKNHVSDIITIINGYLIDDEGNIDVSANDYLITHADSNLVMSLDIQGNRNYYLKTPRGKIHVSYWEKD